MTRPRGARGLTLVAAALACAGATAAPPPPPRLDRADAAFLRNVDSAPAWSPDGRRIAFTRTQFGHEQVFVIPASGGSPRTVTRSVFRDEHPTWSPDAQRLAFASNVYLPAAQYNVRSRLGIVLANGTRRMELPEIDVQEASEVGFRDEPTGAYSPDWSPDGGRIAATFAYSDPGTRGTTESVGIWVQRLGSADADLVTLGDWDPDWSPDGRRLVLTTLRLPEYTIDVVEADGSGRRVLARLGRNLGAGGSPAWSPDGRRIAFARARSGASDLYVIDADGTHERRLTRGRGATDPAWSPSGDRIVFSAHGALFVMRADGTDVRRLTRSAPARCTMVGTNGADVLRGTRGRDVICGLGGADTILGLGGDDVLVGGRGNDRLDGGPGTDVLSGGSGNDSLVGGAGRDLLLGDGGRDVLRSRDRYGDVDDGGAGDDRVHADRRDAAHEYD